MATPADRDAMLAILRRAAAADAGAPAHPKAAVTAALARGVSLGDDDAAHDSDDASSTASGLDLGGGCVLCGETVARLRSATASSSTPLSAAAICAALTDAERAAFERAAAVGAVRVPAWRPWWSGGGRLPKLAADGTRAVEEVPASGDHADTTDSLDTVLASALTAAPPPPPRHPAAAAVHAVRRAPAAARSPRHAHGGRAVRLLLGAAPRQWRLDG